MNKLLLALCGVVLVGCCHDERADSRIIHLPTNGQIVETVNGISIPQILLEAAARQHNWKLDQPVQRDQALRGLTELILINEDALRSNYSGDPQFQADVEFARLKSVADAAVSEFEKSAVSDAQLKSEYDAQAARIGTSTYDFTQLLFASKVEASKAEADIARGRAFQEVFETWKPKAKQGRTMTRVRLEQVPGGVAKAISGMQKGETTKVPVETQLGWAILHLVAVNPYLPPDFDQVKGALHRSMQMKLNREHLDKLKQDARIAYPPGVRPAFMPTLSNPAAPLPAATSREKG